MIAIFVQGNIYYGYKPDVTQEEAETFQLHYFLVDDLPEDLIDIPSNHITQIEEVEGELVITHIEIPSELDPPERITQLESELLQTRIALAELKEANENDKTEAQLALTELAELITGGVE